MTALLLISLAVSFADADESCGAPVGMDQLLSETAGRILLLGELHGIEETTQFVDSVVCLSLRRGETVALGLEQSSAEQERLDRFLNSDGSNSAREHLTYGSPFWDREVQDGRSSSAMLDLIERMRGRIAAAERVKVVALDIGPEDVDLHDVADGRDLAMTRNALAEAEQVDRVLVLAGNAHTRRTAIVHGDYRQESIGTLAPASVTASIRLEYGPGESWSCRRPRDELECGVSESDFAAFDGEPRVLSRAEIDESPIAEFYGDAYDYFVFVGPRTASRPVIDRLGPCDP